MAKFLIFIVFLAVVGRVWFYQFERKNVFYPSRDWDETPTLYRIPFEDITIKTPDNVRLSAWYVPAPKGEYHILFFHGNAGNISNRTHALAFFYKLNFSTLILDYRGYGKSGWFPTEKGVYKDALAAYNYLCEEKKVSPDKIILFGESLGGAVAVDLATKVPVRAVICEDTFSSMLDIGRVYYPFLPLRWLVTQKFDSCAKIGKVTAPKYIIHSREDELIPFRLGVKLYQSAAPPKEFVERPGGHNEYLQDPAVIEGILKKITSS